MSPNGRRAWRKWVRRQDLRRKHKQPKGSVCRMARQARRHIPLVPGVVLPKPLTARSLVGMTMGARKRKARYWMECERLHQKAQDLQEVVDRSVGRKSSLRTIGHTPISLRHHYRIGERLRPCPGCWHCRTTWQKSSIYQDAAVMHRDGCSHDDPSGFCCFGETTSVTMECDGSGVLPARRS